MDQHGKSSLAALTLGAIGVVYGDIGTSVLYAMKEVFGSGHVEFTPDNIYGILSIFFWTLTVIVSIKYVALVLPADNHGEGGLVAMLALASMAVKDRPVLRHRMLIVGIFGTCLFYGDGVITPEDQYRYKSPFPKYIFGFSTQVSYDKWTLSTVLRANVGNYMYNSIYI